MTRTLRFAAAALLAALGFARTAGATTYSTDFTDLWFNPNESGWGLNLIQQNQTMFGTLFVYDTTTAPHWYVVSDLEPTPSGSQTTWQGTLFSTVGPYFGAVPFNPAAVVLTTVGSLNITFTSENTASLIYSVNGAVVSKTIQRQTFRNNDLTGNYLGGLTAQGTACHNGVNNGAILIFDLLTVTHTSPQSTPSTVSMTVNFTTGNNTQGTCTFSGPYTQHGRLGSIDNGNWTCSTSNQGTFTLSQIEANLSGLTGKFHGTDQFCTYDGQFGGVRDVPQ